MKIDVVGARARAGSRYPKPFDEPCQNKTRRRLGLAAGLTQFGVNLLELGPGAWSSQRHWHAHEDEFVYTVWERRDRGKCFGHSSRRELGIPCNQVCSGDSSKPSILKAPRKRRPSRSFLGDRWKPPAPCLSVGKCC